MIPAGPPARRRDHGRQRALGARAGLAADARATRRAIVAVRECVTESARAGLEWLTLFALSTENSGRVRATEIRYLMGLLRRFLVNERPTLMENRVRLAELRARARAAGEGRRDAARDRAAPGGQPRA